MRLSNSTQGKKIMAGLITSPIEPLLDVCDIQGNILAGFNKDQQYLLGLTFQDLPSARRWLRRIAGEISSLDLVNAFNSLFHKARVHRGGDPPGMIATWANVAFSYPGLARLTSPGDADGVPDPSFRAGLPTQAGTLGDQDPGGNSDPTVDWKIGGTGKVPDALLIVASDSMDELMQAVERLRPNRGDGPGEPQVIWEELGQTRLDLPGHEHFGFKDGISQPGVYGRVSADPDVFLTSRQLPPAEGNMRFAKPGQPLIWPGQFVFGYPTNDHETGDPIGPDRLQPEWLKNGSLLVFRRLRQNVAGFTRFVMEKAASMPDMTPNRLGALLVGRWKSGAPIMRSPQTDLPALGAQPLANNDFLFTTNSPRPIFLPGVDPPEPFLIAPEDSKGLICPHAAHIRKVNPRDQDSDLGDQFDTLIRRILRRGIPYGPPIYDPATDDGIDRGLHFLCYQTSIVAQFEKLQQDWANSAGNPKPGGNDVIIGQTADQKRNFELLTDGGASMQTLTTPIQWVAPTGGGYFFAPSISAIKNVLAKL
jgi:Dyp-type peroxidase family